MKDYFRLDTDDVDSTWMDLILTLLVVAGLFTIALLIYMAFAK